MKHIDTSGYCWCAVCGNPKCKTRYSAYIIKKDRVLKGVDAAKLTRYLRYIVYRLLVGRLVIEE